MKLKHGALSLALFAAIGGAHAADRGGAVERAIDHLREHRAAARVSMRDGFIARDVLVDVDGSEHVRFDRTYAGLPVIGGDVVVHSRHGRYRDASLGQAERIDLSITPTLRADEAIVAAGTEFGSDFAGLPEQRLVVYARGKGRAQLAWQVRLHNAQADMTYIVAANARAARILDRWSNLETAAATGSARTLYSGTVSIGTNTVTGGYELRDVLRGKSYTIDASNSRTSGRIYKDTDNTWGDGTNADPLTVAAEAHYGTAVTWDYYLNIHGRHGIANDGRGAYNRVHYGRTYSNAFWNDGCFCMTYGDGDGVVTGPLVSLDIAGHEMSHGVTSRSAGLIYSGESGGLNEATSDILGTMVEFYANNTRDTPDYLIGEQIFKDNVAGSPPQRALRMMYKPSLDGRSPNCYVSTIGNMDVHYSSGVANHFYYLLAEGSGKKTYSGIDHTSPTCNGATLAGIGRSKAQRIWYRALTVYFTSTTNYAAARVATISAANDLYGATSTEAKAVAAAWTAVGVK
ncbi:M4 family metallopeptidase [Lysobacter yangpyeongensis]|uniref:Neutral metalloproteinase n=1 Tax=Lysobacter yangpyeongensis TaxID=346182 RepID=A0ABW0SQ61_9GAMM